VFLDVERIAPCLPGAALDGRDGDTFRGRVKVKVGPIQLTYRGEATIAEQDDIAHRAVILASGKETRGSGGASARVMAELSEHVAETHVAVCTELELSGKPGQSAGASSARSAHDCSTSSLAISPPCLPLPPRRDLPSS